MELGSEFGLALLFEGSDALPGMGGRSEEMGEGSPLQGHAVAEGNVLAGPGPGIS